MTKKTRTGTYEWSDVNMNCIAGCENGCRYCYAQSRKIQMRSMTPETKDIPVERKWEAFETAFKLFHRKAKGKGTIMFPSTHDISPKTIAYCSIAMSFMLGYEDNEYNLLIVSKPHLECIKKLCDTFKDHKDRITFRFSIGSADNKVLKFWETGATTFEERIACLKYAYNKGFKTSVSCEPMLDDNINAVVKACHKYVTGTIWLGNARKLAVRCKWNGFDDAETAEAITALEALQTEAAAKKLYARWKNDPKVEWKDSLREVLSLAACQELR
jgi:DNA repair photolyase